MDKLLAYLRLNYSNDIPNEITSENVNKPILGDPPKISILDYAIREGCCSVVLGLLQLKPYIQVDNLCERIDGEMVKILLEYDPTLASHDCVINSWPSWDQPWFFGILMDYTPCINTVILDNKLHPQENYNYIALVQHRIFLCHKALLALIRVCKQSKSLRGLRGVILEISKQVWRMRGREGCGPRGRFWWTKNVVHHATDRLFQKVKSQDDRYF